MDDFSFDMGGGFDSAFVFDNGKTEFDDLVPTGNAGADSKAEAEVYRTEIQKRKDAEKKRFKKSTSSDFYFCLVFETEEEANEAKLLLGGSKSDKFLNGRKALDRVANIEP